MVDPRRATALPYRGAPLVCLTFEYADGRTEMLEDDALDDWVLGQMQVASVALKAVEQHKSNTKQKTLFDLVKEQDQGE